MLPYVNLNCLFYHKSTTVSLMFPKCKRFIVILKIKTLTMNLRQHVSLKPYNTFGIDSEARYFTEITTLEELHTLLSGGMLTTHPFFILGGGSNVVFRNYFRGIVVKISLTGIEKLAENEDSVIIKAGAGENWASFVARCVSLEWAGLENLTAIPGTVGASPVQNVGAYGAEAKDVIESVDAVETATGMLRTFSNTDCRFGYRDSIFKQELKNRYIITSVTFRLSKSKEPNLGYGNLKSVLQQEGISHPTVADISRAVERLRSNKLPDPSETGSAGSFFKNPVIDKEQFGRLKQHYPGIVAFAQPTGYKISAGWLIEQCGWKGKQLGRAGVYPLQALVLVNLGGCSGAEVEALSDAIRKSVNDTFGIRLEPEAIFI
jgi:UDP-N-acetylmuramate dehydrogenase